MTAPLHEACADNHTPTGYITNQPDAYDKNRSHASTWVCDNPDCRRLAERWVKRVTGEQPVFSRFGGAS